MGKTGSGSVGKKPGPRSRRMVRINALVEQWHADKLDEVMASRRLETRSQALRYVLEETRV